MPTQNNGLYLAHVNPKYFAAVQLFAATKDVRYYLNGVYIEPHHEQGVCIVGTNGHHMAIMHDPTGWCARPIIVGELPKALLAACGKAAPNHLWIGAHSAVVSTHEEPEAPETPFCQDSLYACRIALLEGTFPDWRRVLPRESKVMPITPAINPHYLALMASAAKLLTNSYPSTRIFTTGENCSVVLRFGSTDVADKFVGIIMPMRADAPAVMLPPAFRLPPAALPGDAEARA